MPLGLRGQAWWLPAYPWAAATACGSCCAAQGGAAMQNRMIQPAIRLGVRYGGLCLLSTPTH